MTALKSTEFKYSSYTAGTLLGLTMKVSATYLITLSNDTLKYQYSSLASPTDPGTTGLTNLVVGAIYQFTMPAVPVDDTTVSSKPTSISATLFMVDLVSPNTNS